MVQRHVDIPHGADFCAQSYFFEPLDVPLPYSLNAKESIGGHHAARDSGCHSQCPRAVGLRENYPESRGCVTHLASFFCVVWLFVRARGRESTAQKAYMRVGFTFPRVEVAQGALVQCGAGPFGALCPGDPGHQRSQGCIMLKMRLRYQYLQGLVAPGGTWPPRRSRYANCTCES